MAEPWQLQHLDDKESGGYSLPPSQMKFAPLSQVETSHPDYRSPQVKKKKGKPQALSTGNFAWRSARRSLYQELLDSLEKEFTLNSPDPRPLSPTATRKSLDFPSLSPLEPNPFDETVPQTGSQYGPPPSPVISCRSQLTYEWCLIVPSHGYGPIMRQRRLLIGQLAFFGVVQVLANLTVLGMKQEKVLMLKIPDPSSGVVTKISNMLSSMNFEEVLMSHICSDGSTGTLALWKSKDLPDPSMRQEFGLLATSIPVVGIPNLMLPPPMRCYDE